MTKCRTVPLKMSSTGTRQRFRGGGVHNTESNNFIDQDQTVQRSYSDTNTDESSSLVQKSHEHDSRDIPAGTLTKMPSDRLILLSGDILLSLVPLFFLSEYLKTAIVSVVLRDTVLASLSLYLNHQSKSALGENVRAITFLSPTIFPIIYAGILGTMLQRIGLYIAERSATVGVSIKRRDLSIHSH